MKMEKVPGKVMKKRTLFVRHLIFYFDKILQFMHFAEMSRFTRFVAFGWNVAIYAFCQAQNVCSQAPKTILHPRKAPPMCPLESQGGGLQRIRWWRTKVRSNKLKADSLHHFIHRF